MTGKNRPDIDTILAATPIFGGLAQNDLRTLGRAAVTKVYRKGTGIFTEGTHADSLYVIHSGKVKVFKVSPEGKEHVLGMMGPGQPIGEVALFSGRAYPASAEAVEDSVCAMLSREAFIAVVSAQPQVALSIIATLSERLRGFAQQVEGLSLKTVHSRLAEYLLECSKFEDGRRIVDLSMPKSQLAKVLGTVPETLSRNLGKLREAGIISINGSRIIILDDGILTELSDGGKLD